VAVYIVSVNDDETAVMTINNKKNEKDAYE